MLPAYSLGNEVTGRRDKTIRSGAASMMTLPELATDALEEFLGSFMRRRFGSSQTPLVDIVPNAARFALEWIGNSDALYHNVEHTMLVTLAGVDILRGRALHTQLNAADYAHVIIACLTHDIGYVRGLFAEDDADGLWSIPTGTKVTLPRGSSDAGLMHYHVDRSKLYVLRRIEGHPAARPAAHRGCDRRHKVSARARPGMRRGGLDRPGGGFHRPARRSQLSAGRPTRSTRSSRRSA